VSRQGPISVQGLAQRAIDLGQISFIGWLRRDGALLEAGTHLSEDIGAGCVVVHSQTGFLRRSRRGRDLLQVRRRGNRHM